MDSLPSGWPWPNQVPARDASAQGGLRQRSQQNKTRIMLTDQIAAWHLEIVCLALWRIGEIPALANVSLRIRRVRQYLVDVGARRAHPIHRLDPQRKRV